MIPQAMWTKAQKLIAEDCAAAYRTVGNGPGRKHRPYSVPERSRVLVAALGTGDAEKVASVMMYRFTLSGQSDPLGV